MRELKFRVWLPAYNQMIYPDLCDFIKGNDSLVIGQIRPHFKYKMGLVIDAVFVHSNFDKNQMGEVNDWSDDIDYIIQQYTGLQDKNGKDIYEGDIVSGICLNDGPQICVVGFDTFGIFYTKIKFYPCEEWDNVAMLAQEYNEVIGNIFDNSELLNQ